MKRFVTKHRSGTNSQDVMRIQIILKVKFDNLSKLNEVVVSHSSKTLPVRNYSSDNDCKSGLRLPTNVFIALYGDLKMAAIFIVNLKGFMKILA